MLHTLIFSALVLWSQWAMSAEAPAKAGLSPWLRVDTEISHLKRNRDMTLLAYVPSDEAGLRIVETKTGNVFEVTKAYTDGSFFWSPDGARLFFRELDREGAKITSHVRAWDHALKKAVAIDTFDGPSGMLSFDPRDNRMLIMHNNGIKSRRLVFPDERLAFWQAAQRTDNGKWVAAAGGMTMVTQQGFAMTKLDDDGSGIESFDISPDGSTAVWSTKAGRLFVCKQGQKAKFLDWGRDPSWHPAKMILAYAGGRMVGNKASSYDLKISDGKVPGAFITATQDRSERWPQWLTNGDGMIYTVDQTTDIYSIKIKSADLKP